MLKTPPTPAGCRWRPLTGFVPASSAIGRSSSISPRRSTAPTGRAPRCRRASRFVLAAGDARRAQGGHRLHQAFSETDFTEDLVRRADADPAWRRRPDRTDQRVGDALRQARQGLDAQGYPGLPHGMCSTHKDQINADLLAFIKSWRAR
jgi:non-heme chloroperoxidase